MTTLSLDTYHKELIPIVNAKPTLFEAVEQRFVNIEERLSRVIFKDYSSFSKASSKVSFLTEQVYKGDFKF